MQIDITQEQYEQLTKRAVAEGFPDVTAYIVSFVNDSTEDPRGPLTENELRESVARLKQADASIDAGEGIEAEEAILRIAAKYGLHLNS